jgi:beta-mannosidase
VPASANGPLEMASLEDRGRMHDVHGPWMHMGPGKHYEFFDGVDMLFHSEFGCDGACSVESLREFMPEGSLWPPDGTNPMAWHHGRMWTGTSLKRTEELFGPLSDVEAYVRASQFAQAEGLAYAMEAHRRRAWRTGGALVWHFAEPWPNVCDTCSVDYREHPKPSYFALARANRPVHVSASYASTLWLGTGEFRAEAWGHNAANAEFRGTVLMEVRSMDGRVHASREAAAVVPAESPARLCALTAPMAGLAGRVFLLRCVLRGAGGEEVSRHWSVHSAAGGAPFAGLRSLPAGRVDVRAEPGSLTVRNTGSSCVVGLWFESPRTEHARLDDNWLCLVPGEERRLAVKETGARLVMSAWNISPREVALQWGGSPGPRA